MWSYEESLDWLYGRQALGVKLGLEKVHDLLAALDDPHRAFESVHVAGTNGKGSVVRFLAGALQRAGHRTGTFTSPHLVRFTERITVDDDPIPEDTVARGLDRIRPVVEALDAAGTPPTFFEINAALAFLHFRDQGVEWGVVETGMGGRLDATNVLTPRLTVITNVAMDHAAFLGDHPAQIALEKAGIMKPGVPCITGARDAALLMIKNVSQEREVPMSILGEDYHVLPDVNGLRLAHPGGEAHYDLAAAGEHQLENAALAVAACDALRQQGVHIPVEAVQQALAEAVIPGRLETVHVHAGALTERGGDRRIEVLLDGAHNEAAAQALRYHLGRCDWSGFHLIAGFQQDKDWKALLGQWAPLAVQTWGVPLRSPRTLDPERMRPEVEGIGLPFDSVPDVATALGKAAEAGAERIVVAGSLWLVGEARAHLMGEPLEEIRGAQ